LGKEGSALQPIMEKVLKIGRENGFWGEIVLSVRNPEKFVSTLEELRGKCALNYHRPKLFNFS